MTRKMYRARIVAGVTASLVAWSSWATGPTVLAQAPPAIGETARDFTLPKLDETTIKLADLMAQGPVVMIMLRGWVGYQCPICTRQVGDFLKRAEEFEAATASVVLIYPGDPGVVRDKAEDFVTGTTLPENVHFVLDPGLLVVNQYGLRWNAPDETAYPSTFVFDKDGVIRFVKISHEHGDRSAASDVLEIVRYIN